MDLLAVGSPAAAGIDLLAGFGGPAASAAGSGGMDLLASFGAAPAAMEAAAPAPMFDLLAGVAPSSSKEDASGGASV